MQWTSKNLANYLKDSTYTDSVIIPVVPVEFGQDMIAAARECEFIQKLSAELERQLTGRLIQTPVFTYLKTESYEGSMERLLGWREMFIEKGIEHIFFLTSDVVWKGKESSLGSLIWHPSLPMEHLDNEQQRVMIDESAQLMIKLVQQKWSENN